jgi:Fructose-2,6-bisphosphatase
MIDTAPEEHDPPTHLWLVRHGQAVVNVQPIVGGPKGDTGLTELGVRQAERLRDRLARSGEIKPDVLIASTLPRARQTAEIIAPAFGEGFPILFDDDVQELRVGPEADGLSVDEFTRRFGRVDLRADPFARVDPGGESWALFALRVCTALDRIAREQAGKTVVVVCHGGVIDVAFLHFFGMATNALPAVSLYTRNCSLTHWVRLWDHKAMRWRLMGYNDTAHYPDPDTGIPPG